MELQYIEYHVSHHCNLNCKGCGHFSNLVTQKKFGNLEQFKKDITRLSELFDNIKKIRLMGGEPLLNPECDKFILAVHDILPETKIFLVTNGLLLLKMKDNFFDVLRETNCVVQISEYKPTVQILEQIKKKLNEKSVLFEIKSTRNNMFFKQMDAKGKNIPKNSYENCLSKSCTYLQEGKLSVCALPILINLFSEKFGIPFEVTENDIIDIYNPDITGKIINEKLKKFIPFCRYCSKERQWFDWESVGYNAKISDWLVD